MNQIRAAAKFVRSFWKADWTLEEYPVRVLFRPAPAAEGRRRICPWTAQIVMRGDGFTREEALQRLQERFALFRLSNPLPRPGLGSPPKIEIAASTVVDQHHDLVRDLLQRVVGLNPDDCLVTDESSLWDFHDDETNDTYFRKIALLYGVDVSDVDPPTLTAICRRIEEEPRCRTNGEADGA